jgi:4-amino-4-deoxy-L-arabinose transferase-like glycosyltransferase
VTVLASIAPNKNAIAARIAWLALILATLYVCYFSHLGAIGFVGPDEPRYAWIARDMAETGDWVTPRLYGHPWFEKPPLYYWGAALCFKLFGVSEAAARLPSAISALLATLAMAWLAWRLYGAETARWLLLLLPTTVGMIGFSHAAATDMPFSAMLTVAMVCAAMIVGLVPDESSREGAQHAAPVQGETGVARRWLALVLFGFVLGLAVLAKGPAGVILSGGAVFFWALFTKRWRDALRLFHPAAIATFCLTALPWYVLCARRNPDFFRIFIIEHNFRRYLTPEFQHIQPFWFYIPVVLIAFLPWTAGLLWTAVVGTLRAYRKQISHSTEFLLTWSLFCVLFFSISQSKLPGYVLPAVPAIAMIVSRGFTSITRLSAQSFGMTLFACGLVFLGAAIWLRQSAEHLLRALGVFAPLAVAILIIFASFGIVLGVSFLAAGTEKRTPFLFVSVLCVILPLAFAEHIPLPMWVVSPRYLAREIQNAQIGTKTLTVARLKRSTRFELNFYLHTELSDWNRDPHREVYVLTEGLLPCRDQPKEMLCTDLWTNEERIDPFRLLHLVPRGSPANPPSRQPQ